MKPLSRRLYATAAIALAALLFVGLNIAIDASLTTARLDLTENGRFTLAQGTRNIIAGLKEPITLRFFYSKKVAADYAQTSAYAGRVRDLLREYAALGRGKIVLEEIAPEPFTPEEDEADAEGLTPAPTDSGENVYFGLVGSNRIDGKEVIAYFTLGREPLLEYDLSSLIYRLAQPTKPKLAILSSLPLDTGPGGMAAVMQGRARPYALYQELSQTFDSEMLGANFTSVPPDADVLMIVQPGALNDAQNYAIDQFALNGGRLLVFVDPDSELAQAGGYAGTGVASSSLPLLFKAWGIGFDPGKVIGDLKLAQRVQTSQGGDPVRYPIWLHLDHDRFDARDPVTANLQVLNLAGVGALFPRKDATTHFATLVASSKKAALLDAEEVRIMARPEDLMASVIPTGHLYAIAARISGPAKTAYASGPPPGVGGAQVKSAKNVNIVVMADTDIFDDRFWVRIGSLEGKTVAAPFADNGAFAMNAVENLMGSGDLIALRTRATEDRPFTLVRSLQAQAEAQYREEAEALQQRLTETQQRLHDLQQGQGAKAGSVAMTPAQAAEIERFKRELIATRAALREVERNLRKDIDLVGDILAVANIALVPLLVAGAALGLAAWRRRRRARAVKL